MSDLERLSLNTATTKALTLPEAVEVASRAGLGWIGLWRDRVAETGLDKSARIVRDAGLRVSSLCRGGFLTAPDIAGQRAGLVDNRAAIDEAAALGTAELIMVVGGCLPVTGTSRELGSGSLTGSPTWCRKRPARASDWSWSRCTRCTPPTGP